MINIVRFHLIIVHLDNFSNHRNNIFPHQYPSFRSDLLIKLEAFVDFIAADATKIVAVEVEEHGVNQTASVIDRG
ncbi:MAG: hypothetical protein ACD_41C00271G0001 [uncultured bacterium]|nr:MAG: hypothetical protein ACD_41C00271G0001 [uncultured bacterium]